MRKVIALFAALLVGGAAMADAPGSGIIGGPNSPGGLVPVLKYYPGVYVRMYSIVIDHQACSLVVTVAVDGTPAGQVSHTSTSY